MTKVGQRSDERESHEPIDFGWPASVWTVVRGLLQLSEGQSVQSVPATERASSRIERLTLYRRLSEVGPDVVTLIVAPAGSGKSQLVQGWIDWSGQSDRTAFVSVERGERDAQRFWLSTVGALRVAARGDASIEPLAATPEFDPSGALDRLISELETLRALVVLVVDDLHELNSPDALQALKTLIERRPAHLRVIVIGRTDPQLGLHRLRLNDELLELRAPDLRFSPDETRELLAGSGVGLSADGIARLNDRTEGWAAGIRLAAISLRGSAQPELFVEQFSGSDRTVADYLIAEVLARQAVEVRELLMRTSVVERVCGPLADALTGGTGSERTLLELERANSFVVAEDTDHEWFRYHHLFADLLRLELRRNHPGAGAELHRVASDWLERHGYEMQAVVHAQAAEDWPRAAQLLMSNVLREILDGRVATVSALLDPFPAAMADDPRLALVAGGVEIVGGSLDDADAHLLVAARGVEQISAESRGVFAMTLTVAQLAVARRRNDLDTVETRVDQLSVRGAEHPLTSVALSNDARLVALMELGASEFISRRAAHARIHLEAALDLARQTNRAFIEIGALSYLALLGGQESATIERELAASAVAIAEEHGWGSDPVAALPLAVLAAGEVAQGRVGEGRAALSRAQHALRPNNEPPTAILIQFATSVLAAMDGAPRDAIAALRSGIALQETLIRPHLLVIVLRQLLVHMLLHVGDVAGAVAAVGEFGPDETERGEAALATADVQLHQGDAAAALESLRSVTAGEMPVNRMTALTFGRILEAQAHAARGERQASEAALEAALELAQTDSRIYPFIVLAPRDLLERHPRHATSHANLINDILDVLDGASLRSPAGKLLELTEPLSESELRVLRFLPSNLSASEIAAELFVSTSTVKTHMRHIYDKLGVHRRSEAVDIARDAGLLAHSGLTRR